VPTEKVYNNTVNEKRVFIHGGGFLNTLQCRRGKWTFLHSKGWITQCMAWGMENDRLACSVDENKIHFLAANCFGTLQQNKYAIW